MLKTCTKCGDEKPLNEFHNHQRAPDGKHWHCKACAKARRDRTREQEREAQMKKYYANHTEKIAKQRAYQEANRDKYRKASQRWRAKNPEAMDICKKRYERENPHRSAAAAARYYTRKRNRTPKWLTPEDHVKINEFYLLANQLSRTSGIKYNVDHIIPLFGKNVSGLHVPSNLQVLPASVNIGKSNRWDW